MLHKTRDKVFHQNGAHALRKVGNNATRNLRCVPSLGKILPHVERVALERERAIDAEDAVTLDRMAQHAGATKELVQTEHEKTRALASQIDRDRCQRELADAKLEIAFLRGKIPTRVNLEA